MVRKSISGSDLKRLFLGGVAGVSDNIALINELNVFPVPDGDTGANMHHTLKRAYQEIDALESDDVSHIAERFAYGALMGARGNSGTIMSQLIKGFADGLIRSRTLTAAMITPALRSAVDRAYAAVSEPVEGTILTVARQATENLERQDASKMGRAQILDALVTGAKRSLDRTPDLLPILKEAGVVDAGGMGLLCFLSGMLDDLVQPMPGAAHRPLSTVAGAELRPSDRGIYGYDVQFLMRAETLDVAAIRREMERLGESVLVVGDATAIKVHIHVDNPAVPIDYAVKAGAALDDVVIENMQLQIEARGRGRQSPDDAPVDSDASLIAAIAVAQGPGIQAVFRDLNCSALLEGGAGANPSTEDILQVLRDHPAQELIVLPNDRNIEMAARQAAGFVSDKQVRVLPTHSVQQGISAMVAFGDAADCRADLDTAAATMRDAIASVRSIGLTRATRTTMINGIDIKAGDIIALLDGGLIAAGSDTQSVALEAVKRAADNSAELATVYYGEDVRESAAMALIAHLDKEIAALELEIVFGGQALYPYLISIE